MKNSGDAMEMPIQGRVASSAVMQAPVVSVWRGVSQQEKCHWQWSKSPRVAHEIF
jgi:hypothetical protein